LKIALINPPVRIEEHYGSLTELSPELPLLGIAFLSSYLKKFGFDVDLLDHMNLPASESIKILNKYDIVGFASYITNYKAILEVARKLKREDNIILVGGPHATLFPEDFNDDYIDYVITGEGENVLRELLVSIKGRKEITDIPGMGYKKGGRFIYNNFARPVENLEVIGPPDVMKYDLSRYYPPVHIRGRKVIHTLTSRGCPYKCTFCAASEIMGRRIRYRGLQSVFDELQSYFDQGYDSIMFYDDVFTLNKKRVFSICEEFIKRNLKMKWCCFTRTRGLTSELCTAMKEAGCYLITFGCESSHDKTLKLLKKDLTHEQNVRGIELTHNAGILAFSSFMIGLPGETKEDILTTIKFAAGSKLDFAIFPIFEPFKGTPIYEVCKEMGKWSLVEGEQNLLLISQDEVWTPHGITREEIVLLTRKAFKDFYFSPKRTLGLVLHALSLPPQRTIRFVKGGLSYFIKNRKSTHYTHY